MKYKVGDILICGKSKLKIIDIFLHEYSYIIIGNGNKITSISDFYLDYYAEIDIKSTRREKLKKLYEV